MELATIDPYRPIVLFQTCVFCLEVGGLFGRSRLHLLCWLTYRTSDDQMLLVEPNFARVISDQILPQQIIHQY